MERTGFNVLITICSLLLTTQMLYAQLVLQQQTEKKWEMSGDIFSGATSIVTGFNLRNSGTSTIQYQYTPTFGFGGDAGYLFLPNFSAHLSIGYLQRGAEFTMITTAEKRSFQLSYVDLWGYLEYVAMAKVKFTFLTGLTQSTLVAARQTAQGGNASVMRDFKRTDFGLVIGPGVLLPIRKNKIRIRALFSYGFRDVFAEGHFNDKVKAHNHAYLIQVGYIW